MAPNIPVNELSGNDGELISRLVGALAQGGNEDNGWLFDAAGGVANAIGVVGAVPRRGPVDLPSIGHRIRSLVDDGVSEPFIVRSCRDEVKRHFDHLAAVDPAANARREQYRTPLEEALADPDAFKRFREENPQFTASDDRLRDQIRAQIEILGPISAEEAAEYWAAAQRWAGLIDKYVSDDAISRWSELRYG